MELQAQLQLKKDFAEALLRKPDDPFKAAFDVCSDTGLALQIARDWPKDREVIQAQIALVEERGARSFLPNKEEQARDIYAIAANDHVDHEVRLKAHRLYAEIMDHIAKAPAGNQTAILNQGVMIVKVHESNEEWEKCAKEQQRTLIGNA